MIMIEVNPKLKPLIQDIEKRYPSRYLLSSNFGRLCIKLGIEENWDKILKLARDERTWVGSDSDSYDSKNALKLYLNYLYSKKPELFNEFVFHFLSGLIESYEYKTNFSEIIEDLKLINFPDEMLSKIITLLDEKTRAYDIANKSAQQKFEKQKRIRKATKEKVQKVGVPEIGKLDDAKTRKNFWIRLIAKAEIEKAIEAILEFAEGKGNEDFLKEVVHQSSRWNRLQKIIHQGTMKQDEIDIEARKINAALIDLVSKIKD